MADKLVYDGWLKVFQREVNHKTYDILKDYDAVAAVIINEYNEILLVKQYRPALMRETVEIPAGTMDANSEGEMDCLIRELNEEVQLDLKPDVFKNILSYKPMVGFSNSLLRLYYTKIHRNDVKHVKVKDEDVYEVFWMGLKDLEHKISKGEIVDVKTIIASLYLKAYK